MRAPLLPLLASALLGCKPPPEAPTDLAQLCNYLFREAGEDEEREDYLLAGIENLDTWLQQDMEATSEGYTVDNLDQTIVETLDIGNPSTSALVGAAVAVDHDYSARGVAIATAWADQEEVLAGNYDLYEREYFGDKDQFIGRQEMWLEASSYSESSWAGIIKVNSTNWIQFRWIETPDGWALVHRSWLIEPAEVSWESIEVSAQYLLAVTLPAPWNGSGSVRMMTTWIDADYGVDIENYARNQIVSSMLKQGEMIDEWLAEQVEEHGDLDGILEAGG